LAVHVGRPVVRRWVATYQQHDLDGLRNKFFDRYDAWFKLSVLQRMWHQELSHAQVEAIFDIRTPDSVEKWDGVHHHGGIDALTSRTRGRSKKDDISAPPGNRLWNLRRASTRKQLVKENHFCTRRWLT
jgi:transposase